MSSSECNKKYYIYVKKDSNRMNEDELIISADSI